MKKEEKKNKITMNLPNKLTILRILLVPVIVVVYGIGSQYEGVFAKPVIPFIPNLSLLNLIVMIIFGVAAFTDYLDGAIARKRGIVTNFGKFADPLADKLLVYSVFAMMLHQNYLNKVAGPDTTPEIFTWWMFVIVLAREFIVTGVRYMAASNKKVIAASKLGKAKTIAQYIAVIVVLLFGAVTKSGGVTYELNSWLILICKLALYVMLVLTVISGIDYVVKNKEVFYDKEGK